MLQKFLFDIGFPLGLISMKHSEYSKLINILDIPTYEKMNYVFFYDCLTELTKYYMISKTVSDDLGNGKLFKNSDQIIEEKTRVYENINEE